MVNWGKDRIQRNVTDPGIPGEGFPRGATENSTTRQLSESGSS